MIPELENIPDISDLQPLSILLMYKRFFQDHGSLDRITFALTANFVRLVDLAIHDYQNARQLLSQTIQKNTKSPEGSYESMFPEYSPGSYLLAAGHFESCVSNIKRCIRYFRVLDRNQNSNINPERKKYSVFSTKQKKQITAMRDAIQHSEKDLLDGRIQEDKAYILIPQQTAVELGEHSIEYTKLAYWLRELHEIANNLLQGESNT